MDICDSENATLHAPQQEVKTWKWAIDGDQIAWSRSEGEVWKLTFSIDPTKSPAQMDLTYLDGPFKGVTCQGVYQWGGVNKDMLMLALQDPGAEVERPKTITMTSGEQTSLIFLNPHESVVQQDDKTTSQAGTRLAPGHLVARNHANDELAETERQGTGQIRPG
jgi:uncharacterized protein (TIGR03067 family)